MLPSCDANVQPRSGRVSNPETRSRTSRTADVVSSSGAHGLPKINTISILEEKSLLEDLRKDILRASEAQLYELSQVSPSKTHEEDVSILS